MTGVFNIVRNLNAAVKNAGSPEKILIGAVFRPKITESGPRNRVQRENKAQTPIKKPAFYKTGPYKYHL